MSWAKLDDAMGEHRKIKRALRKSRPAIALHVLGILHCSRYLTDGFVEDEYVEEVLPAAKERSAAAAALIEHGLWKRVDGGYAIHDYLDHNPTREKVLAQRAADAARKAAGRSGRSGRRPDGVQADTDGTPGGFREESVRPVPSRPVPPSEIEREGGASAPDDGIDDRHVTAVVAVLRTAPRLQFDPLLASVTNTIAAYRDADHIQAAHVAVANVSDPNYRTTDAGKALRYAIQELERSGARRGNRSAPAQGGRKPKPWDGALKPVIDDRREAA